MTPPATVTPARCPGRAGPPPEGTATALSFDGVNDWVTVADANDLDLTAGMTIEAWVYPTATTNAWRTVLAKEKSGELAYAMMANSTAGRPTD